MKSLILLLFLVNTVYLDDPEKGWEDVFAGTQTSSLPLMVAGNKSYLMVTSFKMNFLQAMDFCENIHMNLVTIENDFEDSKVQSFITNENTGGNRFWTAGTRLLDGRSWLWMTTGDPVVYTNWRPGEPNGAAEFCIAADKTANDVKWIDLDCNWELSFICERPLDEVRNDVVPEDEINNWNNVYTIQTRPPNLDLLHFNEKDYYVNREHKATYFEALDFCKTINMELVSINSKEENDIIGKYIKNTISGIDFWSAGTRLPDGKKWVWLPQGTPVKFTNWNVGEPSSIHERCLQLKFVRGKGLMWYDALCTWELQVICERPSGYGEWIDGGNGGNGGRDDENNGGKDDGNNNGNNGGKDDGNNGGKDENNGGKDDENNGKDDGNNGGKDDDNSGNNGGKDDKNNGKNDDENEGSSEENNDDYDEEKDNEEFIRKMKKNKPGSIKGVISGGRRIYISRKIIATQNQARLFCEYHNMKLVEVKNEEQNWALIKILPYPILNGPMWIDGVKEEDQWISKQSNERLTYFNWNKNYPHHHKCLGIGNLGKFQDENCRSKKPFLCESPYDKDTSTKTQCVDAIVNIFMTNSVTTKKGTFPQTNKMISSQYVDANPNGGYHVTVDNDLNNC